MENNESEKRKRNLVRSPSYPAIDLETAIELAAIIKKKEGGGSHFIPYQVIVGHWGYKTTSGLGTLKIAALKKFGLIEDRGVGNKREVRLTDLAKRILIYMESNETEDEYFKDLQEAALNPSIHRELWEKWEGNLPSDQAIRGYLLIHRTEGKFAESSVDSFISQFRATISFSNLQESGSMLGHVEDKTEPQQRENKMETMPAINKIPAPSIARIQPSDDLYNIPIYLPSGKMGCISIPKPLSSQEWDQVMAIINVYKPSIVTSEVKNQKQSNEETEQ